MFLKINQLKNKLNSGQFQIDDYPLLEENESYGKIKDNFKHLRELINRSFDELKNIESDIQNWTWNDNASRIYKEIFTKEIIMM